MFDKQLRFLPVIFKNIQRSEENTLTYFSELSWCIPEKMLDQDPLSRVKDLAELLTGDTLFRIISYDQIEKYSQVKVISCCIPMGTSKRIKCS